MVVPAVAEQTGGQAICAEALLVVQQPKVGEHLGDPRAGACRGVRVRASVRS